jgi:hypothetical protein
MICRWNRVCAPHAPRDASSSGQYDSAISESPNSRLPTRRPVIPHPVGCTKHDLPGIRRRPRPSTASPGSGSSTSTRHRCARFRSREGQSHPGINLSVFRRHPPRTAVTSAPEAESALLQGRSSLCTPRVAQGRPALLGHGPVTDPCAPVLGGNRGAGRELLAVPAARRGREPAAAGSRPLDLRAEPQAMRRPSGQPRPPFGRLVLAGGTVSRDTGVRTCRGSGSDFLPKVHHVGQGARTGAICRAIEFANPTPSVRAQASRATSGRDPAADRRGDDRTPPDDRGFANDDQRDRQACRGWKGHRLSALPRRGDAPLRLQHYFAQHPFPNVEHWREIADPLERLRQGLRESYAWHSENEQMISMALAEARDLPIMAPYHAFWDRAAETLAAAWRLRGRRRGI